MPSLLAAVTSFSDDAGVEIDLEGVEVLRVRAPLTIARVTGDGPPRIEIALPAAAPVYPMVPPVVQPAVTATGGDSTIIAFASTAGPTRFTGATLFAGGSLVSNDTNYAIVTLYDATEGGTPTAIPNASATTKTSGSGGSGNWVGGALAIDLGLGVDVAEGHYVVAVWTHGGSGVVVPGGWWRVT